MVSIDSSPVPSDVKALAAPDLYPAILKLIDFPVAGKALDVPAGQGAFALELLRLGYDDITCLDIGADAFKIDSPKVRFQQHDVIDPLPFPDGHFDVVFSIEGIEHFRNPWTFVEELCRVLKPGGRLILSTPNTLSIDARLKYLVSGYFPRFRPLAKEPDKVMNQPVDDAHISPIYFWQLNFFLVQGGVAITRIGANSLLRKRRWINRAIEGLLASVIRGNLKRRGFPDLGVSSDAMLFGDCVIIEGRKVAARESAA